jgi:hypothetical protein
MSLLYSLCVINIYKSDNGHAVAEARPGDICKNKPHAAIFVII